MSAPKSLSLDRPLNPSPEGAYWISPFLRDTLQTYLSICMTPDGAPACGPEGYEPGPQLDYFELHGLIKLLRPEWEAGTARIWSLGERASAVAHGAAEEKASQPAAGSGVSSAGVEQDAKSEWERWCYLIQARRGYYDLCEKFRKRVCGLRDARAWADQLILERNVLLRVQHRLEEERRARAAAGADAPSAPKGATELALEQRRQRLGIQWKACHIAIKEAYELFCEAGRSRELGGIELSKMKLWMVKTEAPKLVDELRQMMGKGRATATTTTTPTKAKAKGKKTAASAGPPSQIDPKKVKKNVTKAKAGKEKNASSAMPPPARPASQLPSRPPSSSADAPPSMFLTSPHRQLGIDQAYAAASMQPLSRSTAPAAAPPQQRRRSRETFEEDEKTDVEQEQAAKRQRS